MITMIHPSRPSSVRAACIDVLLSCACRAGDRNETDSRTLHCLSCGRPALTTFVAVSNRLRSRAARLVRVEEKRSESVSNVAAALAAAALPLARRLRPNTGGSGTISGIVKDTSGGVVPAPHGQGRQRGDQRRRRFCTTDATGPTADALAPGSLSRRNVARRLQTAARRRRPGQKSTRDPEPGARFSQSVGNGASCRGTRPGCADSSLGGWQDPVADAGAFNVNRLKETIPTVQFYSTNPRLGDRHPWPGAPFGLTNDGTLCAVGLVHRRALMRPLRRSTSDVDQVECCADRRAHCSRVTAGAINVNTRKPSFTPKPTSSSTRRDGIRSGERRRSPVASAARRSPAVYPSRHSARRHDLQHQATRRCRDLNNLGVRAGLVRP